MFTSAYTRDIKEGRAAETSAAVLAVLSELYPKARVVRAPVRADLTLGVDLLVYRPDNPRPIPVQVKSRSRPYQGDVALELLDNADTGRLGWAWTTKAELLIVQYPDALLVLHMPTLQALLARHHAVWTRRYPVMIIPTGRRAREYGVVVFVPESELSGALLILKRGPLEKLSRAPL